jgi:transportin-3
MASPELLQALEALYHRSDGDVRERADRWLERWQAAPAAWQAAHDILAADAAALEAQYFAAQTLRTKAQRDLEELPPEAVPALRDSLVALLLRPAAAAAPVRTQLCLALAALAVHLPAPAWGGGGAVGWLAARLGAEPPAAAVPAILELLTVLPQEAAARCPSVRPARRRAAHEEAVASAPAALEVLGRCLGGAGERAREQALGAFAAWLKLSGGEGLDPAALAASPLTAAALEGLGAGGAGPFHAAADAVVELVYCSSSGGRPRAGWAPLVQALVPRVMALRPRFHVAAQRAAAERAGRDDAPESEHDDAEEEARAMARLFAEVGEAYAELVATAAPEVAAPVEALLDVAAHPEDEVAAMSFNFWGRLARALTHGSRPESLAAGAQDDAPPEEERARRVEAFRPAFERLVTVVRGRVRYPDDFDSWRRDARADFRRGRVAVGDVLVDAAAALGGGATLALLAAPLMELSAAAARGGTFDWRSAEAALYCIRAVHRAAPPPGEPLLAALFAALPTLPRAPAALQYTAALTVGAYADWLGATARGLPGGEGPALLSRLLEMLAAALSAADSAPAAALSLRRLAEGAAPLLGPSVPALMELFARAQASGGVADEGGAGADAALPLDEEDVQQVVEAVALAAAALPEAPRREAVQRMLDLLVSPMQAVLGAPAGATGPPPDAARLHLVLPLAERAGVVFRAAASDPEDVAEALVRLWPWLERALDAFGGDAAAAERLVKAPRAAVRGAGRAAARAAPALAAALPPRFEEHGHPCFLWLGSELVKTFGAEPALDAQLGPMLARLLLAATRALQSLADVSARPELADDVFLLAGRGLSYAPRLVLAPSQPALLPALLDAAAAGALVQHREACCSVLAFLVRLLDPATHARVPPEALAHLQASLAPRAPGLVRRLLAGATGALPAGRLREIADVLGSMLKAAPAAAAGWCAEAAAALPVEVATESERQRFVEACAAVARAGPACGPADERALLVALGELSELCRRNRRAMAGAARALLPPELQYLAPEV